MDLFQAVVIGVVQGLTEFLPISSTAHVRIVPSVLGWEDPGAAVTAVTQLGTLAAVLVFFRRELRDLLFHGMQSVIQLKNRHQWTPEQVRKIRLFWYIVLGTLPIAVFGLAFKHKIETDLRSLLLIAASLIVLAVILGVAELVAKHRRSMDDIRFLDTQWIGLAQAVALIPGVSRSGVTITAGLFCGLTREAAARFSFLLSVPAILASGLLELSDLWMSGLGQEGLFNLLMATATAGVVGYLSIAFLIRWLQTHSTLIFIVYRIGLGILIWWLVSGNIIQ